MNIEVVSISRDLLLSDILNTNAAYVSRVLREAEIDLTCKITIDEDVDLVADTVRVALGRSDVLLAIGGVGHSNVPGLFCEAVAQATNRALDVHGRLVDATIFSHDDPRLTGWYLHHAGRLIVSLPGNRQEMAYLLETRVLPLLRQIADQPQPGWLLLRTVGIMESSLKETLGDLQEDPRYLLSFDSFAGQTTIRLAADQDHCDDSDTALAELRTAVLDRLGDKIFGEDDTRLEDVVLAQLSDSRRRLAIAECYTNLTVANAMNTVPFARGSFISSRTNTASELADYLSLVDGDRKGDLTRWNRLAAQRLREMLETDLGLIVYNKVGQGGVQVMVTLASPLGVSVTQRSFGGHPSHINQWACTLALAHLRRWLLVYA